MVNDPAGRAMFAIVKVVALEQVPNQRTNREEAKLAVAFMGKKKRLPANKTQAYALAAVAPNGAQPITISRAVTPAIVGSGGEINLRRMISQTGAVRGHRRLRAPSPHGSSLVPIPFEF
jgi:hypothetical protein